VQDGQADQGVGQPDAGEQQEHRGQQGLVGDDQGQQQDDEDHLLARDLEPGQGVGGRHGEGQGEGDRQQGRAQAVEQVGGQALLVGPEPLVAVQAEAVGQVGRR
jgi:hypothetical protein